MKDTVRGLFVSARVLRIKTDFAIRESGIAIVVVIFVVIVAAIELQDNPSFRLLRT